MSSEPPANPLNRLLGRPGVLQFIRFCIVGASSMVIDVGLYFLLTEVVHLERFVGSADLARPLAKVPSFTLAVLNGFYWNNRWTFRGQGRGTWRSRMAKFYGTNVVGLVLNLFILTNLARLIPSSLSRSLLPRLHDPSGFLANLAAIGVVVIWNFTASKYFTFKS